MLSDRVDAILKLPSPEPTDTLRTFLGDINQYRDFLADRATIVAPLYALFLKAANWSWGFTEQTAFQRLKKEIPSKQVLAYFDPNLCHVQEVDASTKGMRVALKHVEGNQIRPTAFASRTLMSAERNYSPIEKKQRRLSSEW